MSGLYTHLHGISITVVLSSRRRNEESPEYIWKVGPKDVRPKNANEKPLRKEGKHGTWIRPPDIIGSG